jgi:F-type H+-transporting ATPase subunit delta
MLDAVKEDLDCWTELCSVEKDFEKMIISPYFPSEYKQQFSARILSDKMGDLTTNFLAVVIRHNRTTYLRRIIVEYNRLWDAHQGYCPVEVTVAREMNSDEVGKLSADIASAINRKIKLKLFVNPSLIGGSVIRYDSKVIDNTVRRRLQETVETIISRGKGRTINEI